MVRQRTWQRYEARKLREALLSWVEQSSKDRDLEVGPVVPPGKYALHLQVNDPEDRAALGIGSLDVATRLTGWYGLEFRGKLFDVSTTPLRVSYRFPAGAGGRHIGQRRERVLLGTVRFFVTHGAPDEEALVRFAPCRAFHTHMS